MLPVVGRQWCYSDRGDYGDHITDKYRNTMNMKRKIALTLGSALVFFTTKLHAQEQPWNFGVKGGVSMSWLRGFDELLPANVGRGDLVHKGSPSIFIAGGFTAEYVLHRNVGIGLEVLYTRLGSTLKTVEQNNGGGANDKPVKLSILSQNLVVPVMVKLFPMGYDPDAGILAIDLGAQAVFPISVSVKRSSNVMDKMEPIQDSNGNGFSKSDQMKSMYIDALAGLSYEFPGLGVTVEGRYHLGITKILKDSEEAKDYRERGMGLNKDKNIRSHYATLSVGYNFARLLMN